MISFLQVLPAVLDVMKEEATLVTLIKPQFEAHRSQVGRGGIVKDPSVHKEVPFFLFLVDFLITSSDELTYIYCILVIQVVDKIINGVESYGFICKGWIESPLKGAEGNTEFLADRKSVV